MASDKLGKHIVAEVNDIEWDDDGLSEDLPSRVLIKVADDLDDDEIIDCVSDEYGWLINGVSAVTRYHAEMEE